MGSLGWPGGEEQDWERVSLLLFLSLYWRFLLGFLLWDPSGSWKTVSKDYHKVPFEFSSFVKTVEVGQPQPLTTLERSLPALRFLPRLSPYKWFGCLPWSCCSGCARWITSGLISGKNPASLPGMWSCPGSCTCQALPVVVAPFHHLTQRAPPPLRSFSMVLMVAQQPSGIPMGDWDATYPLPQLPAMVGSAGP